MAPVDPISRDLNMGTSKTIDNWIFQDNLQFFLELISCIAGCRLEEWDYFAVKSGIEGTNCEQEQWFPYSIAGEKRTVSMRLADDPGSSVYAIRIDADESTAELFNLAIYVAQSSGIKCNTPFE